MMKWLLSVIFCAILTLTSCSTNTELEPAPNDIRGLWKSRDQKSAKPRSLVAIYKYNDVYYGRMLATYDDEGNIADTIFKQEGRAPGVVGNPPYCGMDFVYNIQKQRNSDEDNPKYKGKIIDPQKGNVYNVEVWLDGERLIIRGKLWIFGKNIPWYKASVEDLPKGFSMKDIQQFVPEVPRPQ